MCKKQRLKQEKNKETVLGFLKVGDIFEFCGKKFVLIEKGYYQVAEDKNNNIELFFSDTPVRTIQS